MSKIKALNSKSISPAVIVQSLGEDLQDMTDLYAVAIGLDGKPVIYASGDLSKLAFAALALQNTALQYLNGQIIPE